MNIDIEATERVLKARTELIMTRRFYGALVSNVEPVLSRKYPTMATDGRRHFFNPDFIAGLTPAKLLGVQAHESEHDARKHHTRRNGRDPVKWNEACDYAINVDLIDQGFELPENALLDEQYRGMAAEDIYRSRELDQQRKQDQQEQEQPPPQPSQDSDEGDGGAGGGEGDNAADDDAGDQGDGKPGDDASDQDGGEGGSQGGDATGKPGDDDAGQGSPSTSGDPGGCGEVLDAATDASDLAELDQQWERTVRQAASMARAVGELPGHITREIERANNPPRDWRDELRAFIDAGALRIETWNRPNRRFVGSGLIMPGSQKHGINKAVFIIDTSGSMDDIALQCVRTESQAALDDGIIDEAVVVYGDTRVTRVDNFTSGDEIKFDPRGGGGTDLRPLFKYVADEIDDASMIICFTDLEIGNPGPEPACPVLFAVTGYPDQVKRYIERAPWGAPGIDVGAH